MQIANEEIREVTVEVPEGHKHLRTRIVLHDGREFVLQEATVANIVRAYVTLKTHPKKLSVRLTGRKVDDGKPGFAEWQLIEE